MSIASCLVWLHDTAQQPANKNEIGDERDERLGCTGIYYVSNQRPPKSFSIIMVAKTIIDPCFTFIHFYMHV